MKLVHWINLPLLLALLAFAAVTWNELPERIPVHFGAGGRPTRWSHPSVATWFAIPIITVLVVGFIYRFAAILPRKPHLINMPDRSRFLALPPERRAPVIGCVQEFAYWATAATILFLSAVHLSMYRGAMRGGVGGDLIVILGAAYLMGPILLIVWSRLVSPELNRQIREAREASDRAVESGTRCRGPLADPRSGGGRDRDVANRSTRGGIHAVRTSWPTRSTPEGVRRAHSGSPKRRSSATSPAVRP
jgi:hypothetical protein